MQSDSFAACGIFYQGRTRIGFSEGGGGGDMGAEGGGTGDASPAVEKSRLPQKL